MSNLGVVEYSHGSKEEMNASALQEALDLFVQRQD